MEKEKNNKEVNQTDKEIEAVLWKKFCETQYHVDFFKWLMENYEIKQKHIK